MANSPTEIANFALSKLGATRIYDLDDAGEKKARTARIHYDQVREEVLRAHRWNFAMRRGILTRLVERPAYGFEYQFAMPMDFIRLDEVNQRGVWERGQRAEFFEIEGGNDSSGLVLLSDSEEAKIRYVANVTDTTKFDSLFTAAFSTLLASRMARAITGGEGTESQLKEQYETMDLASAQYVDAAETNSDENHPLMAVVNRSIFANARFPR